MCETEYPDRPDLALKIFERNGHWRESGVIYKGDWDAVTLGYLESLEKLVKITRNNEFIYNSFGYPIFYLFAHYLEVRMKEIIINGRGLIGEEPDFMRGHDLIQLWNECKRILKIIEGWSDYHQLDDESRQNFRTIDHFIQEICVDPHAHSFRYPVDRVGNVLLDDSRIEALNVHNLAIVIDWMSFILEGFSVEVDEYLKRHQEVAADNYEGGFL